MARFAIYMGVFAIFFLFEDVGMTRFAGPVAGEVYWPGGDLRQRIAAIVPVLSETFWNQKRARDQEEQDPKANTPANRKRCPASRNAFMACCAERPLHQGFRRRIRRIEADPS